MGSTAETAEIPRAGEATVEATEAPRASEVAVAEAPDRPNHLASSARPATELVEPEPTPHGVPGAIPTHAGGDEKKSPDDKAATSPPLTPEDKGPERDVAERPSKKGQDPRRAQEPYQSCQESRHRVAVFYNNS